MSLLDNLSFDQEFSAEMLGGDVDLPTESVVVEDLVPAPSSDLQLSNEFDTAMRVVGDADIPVESVIVEDLVSVVPASDLPMADEFDAAMRVAGSVENIRMPEIFNDVMSREIEKRKIATNEPVLVAHPTKPKFRKWQVDSGPVFGPAGGETTITIRPQCRFRSEKVMATDDSTVPGRGTRILSVTVGNKVQRVGLGNGMLTAFFGAQSLIQEIQFDTSSPWASISIRVLFVQQCTFELSIFGTAEVDEAE